MSDTTLDADGLDYLRRYPDVADAIRGGRCGSAREHFEQHGRFEGRLWLGTEPPPRAAPPLIGACDLAVVSEDAFYVEGWADDRLEPVTGLGILDAATGERWTAPAHRHRREDVERHLGAPHPGEFGVWTAGLLPRGGGAGGDLAFSLAYGDGTANALPPPAGTLRLARREFLEHLLAHLGRRAVLGNATARTFADLDAGLGAMVGELYERIRATRRVTARAGFGPVAQARPKVSLVTVLYGIPDFLYLLVAQFARHAAADLSAFEFVFVSNSPELDEALVRDAELAAFVFGARIRVVALDQNCGFSHANNIGVEEAGADTIAVVNPDVFPRDAAAVRHLLGLAERGLARAVVGGRLHYADGSVMHEGMFFEPDRRLGALRGGGGAPVWAVEHFRKGFPDRGPEAGTAPRRVPAVTGALMVLGRRFAQELGPFDEDFVWGHYEDADLCLRARAAGGSVLLDPGLAFWHYEGRGSVQRPEHAGSGLYNRWLFTGRWGDRLGDANHDA